MPDTPNTPQRLKARSHSESQPLPQTLLDAIAHAFEQDGVVAIENFKSPHAIQSLLSETNTLIADLESQTNPTPTFPTFRPFCKIP